MPRPTASRWLSRTDRLWACLLARPARRRVAQLAVPRSKTASCRTGGRCPCH